MSQIKAESANAMLNRAAAESRSSEIPAGVEAG